MGKVGDPGEVCGSGVGREACEGVRGACCKAIHVRILYTWTLAAPRDTPLFRDIRVCFVGCVSVLKRV